MQVFRRFGAMIAVAAGLGLVPVAAISESLAQAMASAYNHSGLLDQNRALLRAADEDVAQAVATLRPVISYTGRLSHSDSSGGRDSTTRSLTFNLRWLLEDGGARALRVDQLKETVLATRQQLIGIEQNVLLDTVNAFMDMREAIQTVELRQNNVRVIKRELQAARDRFEVGEITRTDVALAESRLALGRSQLAAAQGSLSRSVAVFRRVVGRAPGSLRQPGSLPSLPRSSKAAREIAHRSHPQLVAARHAISAAELGVLRAKASLNPNLSLNASKSFAEEWRSTTSLGLEVQGTISQGGALLSQIRQAEARRDAERAEIHVTRHRIDAEIEFAYADLDVARARRVASDEQIRAARVAFRGVREEATLGARTTLDVLDAEQNLLDAQTNMVSAITAEYKAAYAVLEAAGLLNANYLGLAVQQYDPAAYYNQVKDAPNGISAQGKALERVLNSLNKN